MRKKHLFKSAPRIPKSEAYWKKKGKKGKDVCLVFHDDMDGVVSAIMMKNYLLHQGFKIVKYGIINYQEGWQAFRINSKLITVAVDFSEEIEGVDVYIDHHGTFKDDERKSRYSIKTPTGSAAEGIAQQLGVPFTKETSDWIDMIDSAKYEDYGVDITKILDFDFKNILQDDNPKLLFASTLNQLLKRSDHKTFMEVVHASDQPSIYNIYRLLKLFFPKNNPEWRSGVEREFVEDGIWRVNNMLKLTKGKSALSSYGYDNNGKKIVFTSQKQFWDKFYKEIGKKDRDVDEYGNLVPYDPDDPNYIRYKLGVEKYQIIGNLMFIPSGSWANALRAKSIFARDLIKNIVPNTKELNFVFLQYGNTLQIADLRNNIKKLDKKHLPKYVDGKPIDDLSEYCNRLLENFKKHLDYQDERTKSGGHWGIGTISNIFGRCHKEPFENLKYLDMFKNKIITDISGVKFNYSMPWNETDKYNKKVPKEQVNKKLLNVSDVRTEEEAHSEILEKEILNYIIHKNDRRPYRTKFKSNYIRKIYEIWLDTDFSEIVMGDITKNDISSCGFTKKYKIEKSILFNDIIKKFKFEEVYEENQNDFTKKKRYLLKAIIVNCIDIINSNKFLTSESSKKFKEWKK